MKDVIFDSAFFAAWEDIGLEEYKRRNATVAAISRYAQCQAVFKQMKRVGAILHCEKTCPFLLRSQSRFVYYVTSRTFRSGDEATVPRRRPGGLKIKKWKEKRMVGAALNRVKIDFTEQLRSSARKRHVSNADTPKFNRQFREDFPVKPTKVHHI
jgi:hypothetical protein